MGVATKKVWTCDACSHTYESPADVTNPAAWRTLTMSYPDNQGEAVELEALICGSCRTHIWTYIKGQGAVRADRAEEESNL